ncbi:PLP-dependent aminotransferase family protein [Ihubacter massiliensis]|uniref:PLP-dependent aminotransferase family protein n=1 Tax=Hominibacterium faecale TaxID=2839743 RepID=A0A9J6QJ77_9FIRM|nr:MULTISPECIES: PLP-dependent aminotransferase family protein [Eubacteriales Family XIII. Incertae Sedis]MCI7304269.1 PLP-dependent aminotransferase family protein [Clostridia bacterium]MDE8731600.1 PLP-dependent aminotransferase family protein [Eubacteriales bacterium DFI.9.88]MDY3010990.1 PLP-dependent aminotransferase family protein [Clostridiales Family XIII bacterium]MCO7122888.1 PLP-dependent aminotransferase family protein [Ihubacter massiliensis]MCU7377161.1 PLP-dependent aminotransfe
MLYIDRDSASPLYEQIYAAFVREILTGALAAGDRLPATRKLAEELSVGRNTVDKAYQQLAAEGYIESRIGSGFLVCKIPLQLDAGAPAHSRSREEGPLYKMPARYDFAYGSVDNSVFPHGQWRKSVNNALTTMELNPAIQYPCRQGEPALRLEIARYLQRSRGVVCDPDQMVITCGQQHSMEMIANIFENTGKRFAMEEPGYDGIRAIFANHRFQLQPVPVESDGISMTAVEKLDTDLLYVTPSHQFPTGAVLPVGKRRQLLSWAQETNTYLIEDDYDSELRYYTNPIPALQSLDIHDRTIYTGTFSKSLAPSMRTAYIVFPKSLIPAYKAYYQRYNAQVSPLHQLALADFISGGHYERHINRLRTVYRKKQAALLFALEEIFGDSVSVCGGGAGIHLLLDIKSPFSQDQLIERAESIGIRFYSTQILYIDPQNCPRSQLLLGFPTIPVEAFTSILTELKKVWEI